jgi:hypothetical protein
MTTTRPIAIRVLPGVPMRVSLRKPWRTPIADGRSFIAKLTPGRALFCARSPAIGLAAQTGVTLFSLERRGACSNNAPVVGAGRAGAIYERR